MTSSSTSGSFPIRIRYEVNKLNNVSHYFRVSLLRLRDHPGKTRGRLSLKLKQVHPLDFLLSLYTVSPWGGTANFRRLGGF